MHVRHPHPLPRHVKLNAIMLTMITTASATTDNPFQIPAPADTTLLMKMAMESVTIRDQERLTAVEDCISHHENAVCYSGNSEEAKEAHDCGLSLGKYRAFLELKELDPNITPEDIQGWSMKEIQNRISELSDGETTNASSSLEETSCEETADPSHHQEQKHKGHHWD